MKKIGKFTNITSTIAAGILAASAFPASDVQAKEKINVAIVSFLSGPAAGPFGVPGRNAAELVIEAINKGKLPAPYNTPGFAGAKLEPIFVDESGGNTKQVAEYRNLVQVYFLRILFINFPDSRRIEKAYDSSCLRYP